MCDCIQKNFLEQPYGSNGHSKRLHILTSGRGVEKSVLRKVLAKWMTPNKCCGIFFEHWSGQIH